MLRFPRLVRFAAAAALLPLLCVQTSFGWGHFGHEMINRLAGQQLPQDVPEFLRSPAALNALEYYGPQPDHWRSLAEPELDMVGSPDHFIDLEWADLIGVPLPRKRYDFIRALAYAQSQKVHPEVAFTPENIGLQPYSTYEYWQRLKASMRDYRALAAAHQDTKPVEAEIIFLAGIMGHFVADGSNPLHTTIQYNGWTGPNPNGYNTVHSIHSRFEGDYVNANVNPTRDIAPLMTSSPVVLNDVFVDYLSYLRTSNTFVERLYQLDKVHGFDGAGTPEAKAFVDQRLAAGATELRDLIYTAWVKSADPVPKYRNSQPVQPAAK